MRPEAIRRATEKAPGVPYRPPLSLDLPRSEIRPTVYTGLELMGTIGVQAFTLKTPSLIAD